MPTLDYRGFQLDVPQEWEHFTTDNELVIVGPSHPQFRPNLVVRAEPTALTLAQLAAAAAHSLVEPPYPSTIVAIDDSPLPCGTDRRRFLAFSSVQEDGRIGDTMSVVRDIVVAGGQALDITMTRLFADGPDGVAALTGVADSARPACLPGSAAPAGPTDVTWLYNRPLDLGPAAIRLSAEALASFEHLGGSGRLFRPKANLKDGTGQELLAAELIGPDGALSELGKDVAEAMRRGRPWHVSYQTRDGDQRLRGWRAGRENFIVVPPTPGAPAQLALTPHTEVVRQICEWTGTMDVPGRPVEVTGIPVRAYAEKCLGAPLPDAILAGDPWREAPWRNVTLTDPSGRPGLSWVATPLGAANSGQAPGDGTIWLTTPPHTAPLWQQVAMAWLSLTS